MEWKGAETELGLGKMNREHLLPLVGMSPCERWPSCLHILLQFNSVHFRRCLSYLE